MRFLQCWALICLLLSLTAALPARAEEANPKVREKFCADNPQRCKEINARRELWCNEHPSDCAATDARRAALKARCEEDPASCGKNLAPTPTQTPVPVPAPAQPSSPSPPGAAPETREGYIPPLAPPNLNDI